MEQDNDADVLQAQKPNKHKGKHDKPKPRDDDPNIDRWKIEKFDRPVWSQRALSPLSSLYTEVHSNCQKPKLR